MIWKREMDVDMLNKLCENCLNGHLGIKFLEIGEDYLTASMPVDHRTVQPHGVLHGGASVALAETLGGVAAECCTLESDNKMAVGVEINANHLRPGTPPFVIGKTYPVKIGRRLQVWNIEISDTAGKLVCTSRITLAIVDKK